MALRTFAIPAWVFDEADLVKFINRIRVVAAERDEPGMTEQDEETINVLETELRERGHASYKVVDGAFDKIIPTVQ